MRFAGLVKTVLPDSIRQVLSDNGSEFAGAWDEYAKQQGWRHCYTCPRCPKRNACSERFKRTVQEECVDYQEDLLSDDRRGFNDCLLAYWQRYNGDRPHRGLGCLTPCQAFAVALLALAFIPAQQAAAQAPELVVPDAPTFVIGSTSSGDENILTGLVRLSASVTNTGGPASTTTLSAYRVMGDTALAASAPPPPGTIACAADTTALCRESTETGGAIFGDGSMTVRVSREFPARISTPYSPPRELGVYQYYACVTHVDEVTTLNDNCSPSVAARVAAFPPVTISAPTTAVAEASLEGLAVTVTITDALFEDPVATTPPPVRVSGTEATFTLAYTPFGSGLVADAIISVIVADEAHDFIGNLTSGNTITVTSTNQPPVFADGESIPDQVYEQNQAITPLTLPEAMGGNGALTYDIPMLPEGLTFDDTARVLSDATMDSIVSEEHMYIATARTAAKPRCLSQLRSLNR